MPHTAYSNPHDPGCPLHYQWAAQAPRGRGVYPGDPGCICLLAPTHLAVPMPIRSPDLIPERGRPFLDEANWVKVTQREYAAALWHQPTRRITTRIEHFSQGDESIKSLNGTVLMYYLFRYPVQDYPIGTLVLATNSSLGPRRVWERTTDQNLPWRAVDNEQSLRTHEQMRPYNIQVLEPR